MSNSPGTHMITDTMHQSIQSRRPPAGRLLHHCDRGYQSWAIAKADDAKDRTILALEAKIQQKNEVVAELPASIGVSMSAICIYAVLSTSCTASWTVVPARWFIGNSPRICRILISKRLSNEAEKSTPVQDLAS